MEGPWQGGVENKSQFQAQVQVVSPLLLSRRVLMQAALGQSQSSFRSKAWPLPTAGARGGQRLPLSTGRKGLHLVHQLKS